MKWLSIAILVMVVFAFSPAKSAQADDFSFSLGFRDELSPYGSWVSYSNYGNVWRPNAYSGWQPYSDGYWGYTNSGPTWYGNEPYAPYVYRYGYWIYTPQFGWVWIPGTDYHSGRVNWSYGGGYIGWRPQFPSGYNYGGYGGSDYNFWVAIDTDHFGYRNYRPYRLRGDRVRDLFSRRVFRQRYNTFRRADLERIVRRPVRFVNVRERAVRIGNRRSRILVTPDEEVRIRRHVTQIRGRRGDDDRRRVVERDTVMKRKFDDIRRKEVRRDDDSRRRAVVTSRDRDRRNKVERARTIERNRNVERARTVERNRNVERKQKLEKARSVERKRNVEKNRIAPKRKVEKVEKKSRRNTSKSNISRGRVDRDRGTVRKASSGRRGDRDTVRKTSSKRKGDTLRKASGSRNRPAKVERARHSGRKSEMKAKGKARVSKVKATKKQSVKKQNAKKPRSKQKSKRHH